MTTRPSTQSLCARCGGEHPVCVVCGHANPVGWQLRTEVRPDGSVAAVFVCPAVFQGYDGLLHGGVTSALLDAVMTHCLFAYDVSALTAEMTVRFRRPIAVGQPVEARAWLERSHARLHLVGAELRQDGDVKATAAGKFLERAA